VRRGRGAQAGGRGETDGGRASAAGGTRPDGATRKNQPAHLLPPSSPKPNHTTPPPPKKDFSDTLLAREAVFNLGSENDGGGDLLDVRYDAAFALHGCAGASAAAAATPTAPSPPGSPALARLLAWARGGAGTAAPTWHVSVTRLLSCRRVADGQPCDQQGE
jgi:hypothetical protein